MGTALSERARLLVEVRRATGEDAGEFSRIARESKALWGYSRAQLDAWRDELTLTPDSIAQRPTFAAVADEAIAGFYQLALSSRSAALEHFWVRPRFARRGIGRALLEHAGATAAAAGHGELEIDADPHAEPFYLACGATRTGVVSAPTQEDPARIRPQLRLALTRSAGQRA